MSRIITSEQANTLLYKFNETVESLSLAEQVFCLREIVKKQTDDIATLFRRARRNSEDYDGN